MEAYKMHDFINTNVESHQNETVLICTYMKQMNLT